MCVCVCVMCCVPGVCSLCVTTSQDGRGRLRGEGASAHLSWSCFAVPMTLTSVSVVCRVYACVCILLPPARRGDGSRRDAADVWMWMMGAKKGWSAVGWRLAACGRACGL
jgi:hypothetical protein